MTPIRTYTNWNTRYPNDEKIEPYRKYYLICEGANTETWYFQKLIDLRKILNIHPLIDIILLEKTDSDRDISYPKKLIEFADKQKKDKSIDFDKNRDKMIVVFDGDIFENRVTNYDEVIGDGEKHNILAVTNPGFELFLLLHYDNSYNTDILPNEKQILKNEKTGNQTPIYTLLLKRSGINSKKNSNIGDLALNIETAIQQEKLLNQDIHKCKGLLTSNIGKIIERIKNDSL